MAFSLDDDERASAASSDNEQDELMEDADDNDADMDADGDEDDNDDNDGDDDNDDEGDGDDVPDHPDSPGHTQQSMGRANGAPHSESYADGESRRASASPRQQSVPAANLRLFPQVRPEALNASLYDIVPTMAAPQSTSINAIATTPDFRFWFTGGSDCYVRKYDGAATINGKTLLTVAQRHPFVDSVVKAGVLMSYWESEDPQPKAPGEELSLSPVYSLAAHHNALWVLSGLESGCINLQSVRHDEGKRIASLQKHASAVSALTLAHDEHSVLSGSWDKSIYDWDLHVGAVKRSFLGSGGQISAIEIRPASSLPVPRDAEEPENPNGTFTSNNAEQPLTNGVSAAEESSQKLEDGMEDAPGDTVDDDSLFGDGGDGNSLFGENDMGAPSGGHFDNDDDEFRRAIELDLNNHDANAQGDIDMERMGSMPAEPALEVPVPAAKPKSESPPAAPAPASEPSQVNGLPHSDEPASSTAHEAPAAQDAVATSDSTFFSASIDGVIRVWDRRQQSPIATVPTARGVPPWCMGACWSPDGNYIYAGRRNGTVEEYSLHKGFRSVVRTLKLPAGSGAVSAVRAMPNSRHLICASHDILRLYDLKESAAFKHSSVPFLIVPGPPRAGVISSIHIDPTCRFMLTSAGTRGWEGSSTEVLLGYEIGVS